VFFDRFDRGGPTQNIGSPWDDVNATGEWWIDYSTQPKYPNDSALYEVTGEGEIFGPEAPEHDEGWSAAFDVIDELPGNRYRILFGAPEDLGRPDVPPLPGADCIIAEYEVGEYIDDDEDGSPEFTSCVRIYTRFDHVETLVKEKWIPPQATNVQNGRRFYAHYVNTNNDHTFCAWIGSSAYPSLVSVVGLIPPGRWFGAANNSLDQLPIEIDDYTIEIMTWENVEGESMPCYACTCVCYDYAGDDPNNEVVGRALYPGVLQLRIRGQCCTPFMTPCDTSSCPGAVDETINLEWESDYPTLAFNGWVNHTEFLLCGYPFQFRAECGGTGFLTLSMWIKWAPDDDWSMFVLGGAISLVRNYHTCVPIYESYTLTLNSLSGFPCCISCTRGEYTIEIFA
jgi:hypothetical protein